MRENAKEYVSILSVLLLFCLINLSYSQNNLLTNKDEISDLKLKENYFEYLTAYPTTISTLKANKNWKQIAVEFSNVCESLFQLKQYNQLKKILEIAKPFSKKYNLDAYAELQIAEQKMAVDFVEYEKCIKNLTQLLPSIHSIKDKNAINLLIAHCYFQLDEIEIARKYYHLIFINQPNFLQLAQAYNGIGSCCYMDAKLDSAKYYYEKGLEICYKNNCKEHTKAGQLLLNLGYIDKENGDYKNAKIKIKKSLLLSEKRVGSNNLKNADLYGALGGICMIEEDYENALMYLQKEKEILEHNYVSENSRFINFYLNKGTIYQCLNDLKRAEEYIKHGLTLANIHFNKSHNLAVQLEIALAIIYYKQNKIQEAKTVLKEVIPIVKQLGYSSAYLGDAYCALGDCLLKEKNTIEAIVNYQKAAIIYDEIYGKNNVFSVDAFIGLSNAYIQKKEFKKAFEVAQTATTYTMKENKIIHVYDHWETQLQVLKCKKELLEAKQTTESVDDILTQIKQTTLEALKIKNTFISINNQLHYAEKIAELNKLGIYMLMQFAPKNQKNLIDKLLFFVENDKATILRNNVLNIKSNALLPDKLKENEASLKSRLNYFTSMRENEDDETKLPFLLNDSILFYTNQYESFIKSLEIEFPKLYKYKYAQTKISSTQIQKYLTTNEVFLEYFNDATNYYCLAITKTNCSVFYCGNKNTTDSMINELSISIQQKKYNYALGSILGNKLIDKRISTQNWIIAPDDLLNTIPFDALMHTNNPTKPDYFLFQHTIQYTFSAAIYCNNTKQSRQQEIQAYYPNFTNTIYAKLQTQNEQKSIRLLKNHIEFNDTLATLNNFINKTSNAKIIHVASHLEIDTINPTNSILIFQPTIKSSYSLAIDDIKKMQLDAQLITLATCKSNYGATNLGEGLLNFPWTFYFAGAHNISTTKWNAADKSTDNIIADFYTNLRNGKSKTEAIQLAKINYLNTTDAIGAQPFYWANFALNGDASAINITPSFLEKYWLMPIALLTFLFILLASSRKVYPKNQ